MGAATAPAVDTSHDMLAHTAFGSLAGFALLAVIARLTTRHRLLAQPAVGVHCRGLLVNGSDVRYPRVVDDFRGLVPQLMLVQLFDVGEEKVLVVNFVDR